MPPEKLRYTQNLMADHARSIPDICHELGDIPSGAHLGAGDFRLLHECDDLAVRCLARHGPQERFGAP